MICKVRLQCIFELLERLGMQKMMHEVSCVPRLCWKIMETNLGSFATDAGYKQWWQVWEIISFDLLCAASYNLIIKVLVISRSRWHPYCTLVATQVFLLRNKLNHKKSHESSFTLAIVVSYNMQCNHSRKIFQAFQSYFICFLN